jgi:hypothetical protein
VTGAMMRRIFMVVAVVAAQSGAVLAFQPQCHWVGQRTQVTAQANCRVSRTPLALNMGMRDTLKKAVGTVAAGISFALAPGAARAMDSEGGVAVQPRLVLPSQEAFMQRPELLMSEPEPLHIRVVQSPIFQGSVGIVAAGAVGGVVYQQMQKRQTESMRSMLSSKGGIDIDASILDEARINRPGAKKFEYSGGGPAYGQYRPPPGSGKLSKNVADKYKFKKYGEKRDLDEEAMAKLDGVFGGSSASDSPRVEVVGDDAGPKTSRQKALEKELKGADMDEMLARAMADPTAMDPAMLAAALPQLQQQLSEVLKEGISREEIEEVRKSFSDMGIDVNELFKALDEMEAAGLDNTLGKDGKEFFKTLRQILVAK